MKKIFTILSLAALFSIQLESQAQIIVKNDSVFKTADQMLLANELFESGEPFAEFLGYNLDNLDPMVLNTPDSISYTTGIEGYEFSRYLLGTVISRSGIGLHMMWSPMISQMAAMEAASFDGQYTGGTANGFKEDDELMKTIMHFGMLAHQMAPANPFPQFADFESGNMHLPQSVASNFQMDFGSLRWDRSKMTKVLNPAAIGQTMLKQYFWAQDMLSAFHDSLDNGIDATGSNSPDSLNSPNFDPMNNIYYGGNNLDGFIGQVLTAESINKTMFLINNLAYDGTALGMVNPATYNPANGIKYFPHRVSVSEKPMGTMLPPAMDTLIVLDASSHLFDQLSFLWASVNFKNMMDPSINDAAHYAYHEVFDGNPFPAPMSVTGMPGPFDLMMGTSKVIFLNSMMMHFNTAEGSFVDEANLNSSGAPVMGNEISATNVGYMLVVLNRFIDEFSGTPLDTMALNALNAQTNFIINKLKSSSNGYFNSYTVGSGPSTNALSLEAMAAITRGLYASYKATSNANTLQEANNAYNYLINNFYMPSHKIFKSNLGNTTLIEYTPFTLATISGALREASEVGNQSNAAIIYTRISKSIFNKMLLAEAEQTGETGNDSDGDGIPYIVNGNLPFVFAAEAQYDLNTGISQNNPIDIQTRIYPNPANQFINTSVVLPNATDMQVRIFDLTGKLVKDHSFSQLHKGNNTLRMDIDNLQPAVYYVQYMIHNEILDIKKLVVRK